MLTFTARTQAVYAKPRTVLVFVQGPGPQVATEPLTISGPGGASRSASVLRAVAARSGPSASSRVVARVHSLTSEHIGIRGTSQPEILPAQVSHVCVCMPNAAVLRPARPMPVGSPVTIT